MTLGIFVAVVAYVLMLVVVIGTSAGTARHLWALSEQIHALSERVDNLSRRVDEARYATQVVPDRILSAYERTRR